ncbi:MAG: hypothetical protein SW019_17195 [Actinomycetota bacterium]|nr:hypothetical protein [Actinomycetota bacterium]
MTLSPEARLAAERWFLARGLPAVLRPGTLVRRVWPRSAPALATFATMVAFSIAVVVLTGQHTIDVDGTSNREDIFVLGIVVLVIPVSGAVGWLVSRTESPAVRAATVVVSLVVAALGAVFGGPSPNILVDAVVEAVVVALILVCTATGVGAVLGWAVRTMMANLASVGNLLLGALPVMLLTVLAFFNGPVWTMAGTVSRPRLWLALIFLMGIAVTFLVSGTVGRVGPILRPGQHGPEHTRRLDATPFGQLPDRPRRGRLSRYEQVNVVFVLVLSQVVQILTVAIVTGFLFLIFGLILIDAPLLHAWTGGGRSDGDFLGMTLPIPQALMHVTMFLTALTFMYLAARAVGDKEYRAQYVDPLTDDLQVTLLARDRYRAATAS